MKLECLTIKQSNTLKGPQNNDFDGENIFYRILYRFVLHISGENQTESVDLQFIAMTKNDNIGDDDCICCKEAGGL